MQTRGAAVGIVEQKGWVTALWVSGRWAQSAPVAICISGVRGTSLCPKQALFSRGFTEMHRDFIGYKAVMTLAPS